MNEDIKINAENTVRPEETHEVHELRVDETRTTVEEPTADTTTKGGEASQLKAEVKDKVHAATNSAARFIKDQGPVYLQKGKDAANKHLGPDSNARAVAEDKLIQAIRAFSVFALDKTEKFVEDGTVSKDPAERLHADHTTPEAPTAERTTSL